MTEFIMLVGLPGCGKSTYAKKVEAEGYVIHSSDAIREELFGDVNSQEDNAKVFEVLHKRIKDDLAKGTSCVYDATNMSMKRRKAFLDEISKISCRKKCVLFVVPIEVCKEWNQKRERKVPDEVYDKMLKSFWVPAFYEGWDVSRDFPNYSHYFKYYDFKVAELNYQVKIFCDLTDRIYEEYSRERKAVANVIKSHRLAPIGFMHLDSEKSGSEILDSLPLKKFCKYIPDYRPEKLADLFYPK